MNNEKQKQKIITSFLKYWADIAKENPRLSFNSKEMENSIYNSLIYLGVSNEDRKVNLKDDDSPSNFQSNHSYSYLVKMIKEHWLHMIHIILKLTGKQKDFLLLTLKH